MSKTSLSVMVSTQCRARVLAPILGLCLLGLLPGMAPAAATINVPADYPTIQSALDNAEEGVTIIVAKNKVYKENLKLTGRTVILQSEDPLDPVVVATTVIDGGLKGPTIILGGTEIPGCVIEGFTIKNGKNAASGGGIVGNKSRATIRNNVITGNVAAVNGGGLYACEGEIRKNRITGNEALRGGGLALCGSLIQDNEISGNTALYNGEDLSGRGGGLFDCDGSILNNDIQGNTAESAGGGLSACDGIINYNDISGNAASSNKGNACNGGGVAFCEANPLAFNAITGNVAADEGGGVYGCDVVIENNEVAGNDATYGGGFSNCGAVIRFNWISNNSATVSGGGIANSLAYIGGNEIVGNKTLSYDAQDDAVGAGGGIFNCDGLIENNTIVENRASFGGGLAFSDGTIQKSIVGGNSVVAPPLEIAAGGGIYRCNGVIESNDINNNYVALPVWIEQVDYTALGGGLARCNGTIQGNRIYGNSTFGYSWRKVEDSRPAVSEGGGLYSCNGSIQNNVIYENETRFIQVDNPNTPSENEFILGAGYSYGGGLAQCNGTIQNNVVDRNSSDGSVGLSGGAISGGGVFVCRGITRNTIIWNNSVDSATTTTIATAPQWVGGSIPDYCDIMGWTGGGDGNFDADPMFVNELGGDFHLSPGSPCIDAGTEVPELTVDSDGVRRGPGYLNPYDIGAYEIAVVLPATPTPTLTPLPPPTITPPPATPSPTPDSRTQFNFEATTEGWTPGTSPAFNAPNSAHLDSALTLTALNNSNTFGFWQSPRMVITNDPGSVADGDVPVAWTGTGDSLFSTTFHVKSNVTPAAKVPTLRVRSFEENFERTDVLVSSSEAGAGLSPGPSGMGLVHYFVQPAGRPAFRLAFDLSNFNPADDPFAQLDLDSVDLQGIPMESLTGQNLEADFNFAGGADNAWVAQGTTAFTLPAFTLAAQGLTVQGNDNGNTGMNTVAFGFWTSAVNNPKAIVLQSGRLYRVTFVVGSDAMNADSVPTFRLRLNEASNQASVYANFESKPGAAIPTLGSPKTYQVYFAAPDAVAGEILQLSFDYLFAPGGGNDPTVKVFLQYAKIESFDAPALLPF